MVLTMYIAAEDGPAVDERVLGIAIEESLLAAELGYNPWFTEHHFRGPWHSNPMQFAALHRAADLARALSRLRRPLDPVLPSGAAGREHELARPAHPRAHALRSGQRLRGDRAAGHRASRRSTTARAKPRATRSRSCSSCGTSEPAIRSITSRRRPSAGTIRRRVVPAAYRKRHPTIIRTASRDAAVVAAAQNGWPAFLGTFGSTRCSIRCGSIAKCLAEANHPQDVVDEVSALVHGRLAERRRRADRRRSGRQRRSRARRASARSAQRFVEDHGPIEGPIGHRTAGSTAAAYAAGGDMSRTIAGHPRRWRRRSKRWPIVGINHLLGALSRRVDGRDARDLRGLDAAVLARGDAALP